uniref:ABC transporter permease n=1 Tax=candidate division WOR-3 bacterium TaxID=2052148 RepID=A0A7C4GJD6_UNCW3
MRTVGAIVAKELKEILTLRALLPFFAIMLVFLFIGRAMRSERQRSRGAQRAVVVDHDSSPLAETLKARLRATGLMLVETQADREAALELARAEGASVLVVLPESLSERVQAHEPESIEVYTLVKGFSLTQTMKSLKLRTVVSGVNERLVAERLSSAYPGASAADLQDLVRTRQYVVVRDRLARGDPEALQGMVMSQTFLIPVVLLMVIIYASQMIAASIGQEKENKTLETLLTVPINRVNIVVGKMVGAAIAAVVMSAAFMVAMVYYGTSLTPDVPAEASGSGAALMQQLDLGLGLRSFALVAVGLFLAIVCALALATLLAVFAEDARNAQATVTPLMLLCLIPYFFVMFFDVQTVSLPLRVVIYAIPFSYPFLTPQAAVFGNYGLILAGYGYMGLFAAATVFVAARIFSTDLILTAKLRLRRRR